MKSRKIIVTGASRGIGFEMVKQFAAQNMEVLAITRNGESLKILNDQYQNISVLEVELTQEEGLNSVCEFLNNNWKNVDVLIHNAGILINKPFEELTKKDFQDVFDVNVFSVAELTKYVLPFMKKGSHVVGISSIGGVQGSLKFPGLAAYSSSKGALITLMELLAEEFKEKGISFNTLALGAVQTEMLEQAFPGYKAPIDAKNMAEYIVDFSLNADKYLNGKVISVSTSNP